MRQPGWARRMRRGICIVLCAMTGWLLLAPIQLVYAHGDDRVMQLTTVVGDAFHLSVWCAPSILRTGEIHIVTAVHDADTGGAGADGAAANGAKAMPRADVLVQVELTPLEGTGARMIALSYPIVDTSRDRWMNDGKSEQAILHEAAFVVNTPGRYQVQVKVADAAGASGAASFPITVVKVPVWFQSFIYVQLSIGALVGVLLLRRGQQIWLGRPTQP